MADTSITREERYLEYLTGDRKGNVPKPVTRRERYLYELCLKGIGGEISPEEIKNAVNEYLEKNPVLPGATTEQAQQIEQNKTDIASLKTETASLKEDISTKITKFYASNQGETHITDSDNGKIQDMMIYGKSSQDGVPTPENPVEIKSVVNPTVKITNEDGTQFKTVTIPYTLNAIPVQSGGNVTIDGQQYIADYVDVERGKLVRMVDSSKLDNTQSIVGKTEWLLAESQETDLTTGEITAFKALATYYPTTNISISSEQLDGYTVFNYPMPFEDEWIKTKKDVDSLKARLNDIVGYDNAAAHNSIYRGKNLGTQFTAEMSANIKNGTFKDLYCGDYLVINGTTYRFMDLNYLFKTGDTSLEINHILVVPDAPMYNHVMNDTNTTEGGYVGSKMYTSGLDQALAKIKADFGESHIVTYRNLLVNTVSNGVLSNWAWYSRQIDLMNEEMVYGTRAWSQASQNGYDTGTNKSQLAAFQHNHSLISSCRSWYWLRAVRSSAYFCLVDGDGFANGYGASNAGGVRPCFLIS